MARLNSRVHKDRLDRLERMADGIAQHSKEPKFPPALDEAETRTLREDLDKSRTDYEAKQRAADLAYDEYNKAAAQADKKLANSDDALRGFYGKDNPILADFGTKVPKERTVAKRKDSSTDKPK